MSFYQLPEYWESTKLESLATDISYGYTASSSSELVGPKMLRITDIQDNKVNWTDVPYCQIESDKKDKYLLKKNDLVFARTGATVGKSFLIRDEPPEAVYASYLIRVRTASEDLISLLAHFFNSNQYWQQITEFSSGIGQPNVNGTKLKGLDIPLPPLAEQKVIADKLDTLLAQVETTKARLERIPDILKRFRQSVLAAAVSGKLTEGWRGEQKETVDWEQIILSEAAKIIDPHPSHRTPKAVEGGVPYIGIGDLRNDGSIDFENARKVSQEVLKEHNERYALKEGDFVFGKIGTLGKATVLPTGIDYTLSANVILIQPLEHLTTPKYLQYFLSSPSTLDEIAKQANSTSQAAFGIKKMRAFSCQLPGIKEQTEIVRRVEEFFAFADIIEQKTSAAFERVSKLTQSILAKAFRGELTADWRAANPDLIRGENSAEALLEKIKAEREALKKQPKPRRTSAKKRQVAV